MHFCAKSRSSPMRFVFGSCGNQKDSHNAMRHNCTVISHSHSSNGKPAGISRRWYPFEFLINTIARYDEIDVLKKMVSEGFNVDSQDEYGTTALHNACSNGNLWLFLAVCDCRDCVKLLVESGCHLLKNDAGNTALRTAFTLSSQG